MSSLALALFLSLTQGPAAGGDTPRTEPPRPLVVGQPAPEFALESWERPPGEVRRTSGSGSVALDPAEVTLGQMRSAPTLAGLGGLVCVVQRYGRPAQGPALELVEANRDSGALLLFLASEEERVAAHELLAHEGLPVLIGILAPGTTSPYARAETLVIGRSGELVSMGSAPRELEKAVFAALARPAGLALERALDASLESVLELYWSGRYTQARKELARRLEALTKSGNAASPLGDDVRYLAERIDDLEQALLTEVDEARAASEIERLVDLDLVLARGFEGASARRAEDGIKALVASSLHATRLYDYKKLLELLEKRPPYFPRREDGGGRALAKKLESFLRSTANDARAQQHARALLQRFQARHGDG